MQPNDVGKELTCFTYKPSSPKLLGPTISYCARLCGVKVSHSATQIGDVESKKRQKKSFNLNIFMLPGFFTKKYITAKKESSRSEESSPGWLNLDLR